MPAAVLGPPPLVVLEVLVLCPVDVDVVVAPEPVVAPTAALAPLAAPPLPAELSPDDPQLRAPPIERASGSQVRFSIHRE